MSSPSPSWRRGRQALLAVTVMVLVTLGCASGAQADAAFEGSSPGNAETVAEPLTEIELRFSDPISLNETETRLLDADGTEVPVVNMLSDRSHPLQAFADALTMRQRLGVLTGQTVAYVGDYANVARSLAEISLLLGMHVRLGCPRGFDADDAELERLSTIGTGTIEQVTRAAEAAEGANAVHTDTWVSMGQETEKAARRRAFEGYTVDDDIMALADPNAVFMHCLPAYRGFEVSADVIDGPQSAVFQQGHNRMHAARGALAFVLSEVTR